MYIIAYILMFNLLTINIPIILDKKLTEDRKLTQIFARFIISNKMEKKLEISELLY